MECTGVPRKLSGTWIHTWFCCKQQCGRFLKKKGGGKEGHVFLSWGTSRDGALTWQQEKRDGCHGQGRGCMRRVWPEEMLACERLKQSTVKSLLEESEWSQRRWASTVGSIRGMSSRGKRCPHNGPASEAEQAPSLGKLVTNLRQTWKMARQTRCGDGILQSSALALFPGAARRPRMGLGYLLG